MSKNILRPYQDRDLEKIEGLFETYNSVLYQCPTGGGKSVVASQFVIDRKKSKILVLAHKRELVFQMKNRLKKQGLRVGVIIGNIEENIDADIIVASIRTVTLDKRISTILEKKFDYIIIDEAHRSRASSYEKVLDSYKETNPEFKLLGLTATPYRSDRKGLDKYFETLLCSDDVPTLQKDGWLANFKVFYTPVPKIDEEVKANNDDYQIQPLSEYMRKPEMLQFMVDSYKKEGKDRQMIVFCVDKKHAKAVQAKYIENGYDNIGHIDSDTTLNERESLLTQFAKGDLKIITCIETLTEGVDLPETGCIQLGRPTKSLILYLQMVGRGARPKEDGSECIILDNAGCTQDHNMPDSPKEWTLDSSVHPNKPGTKHKVVGKRKDGTFTEDENEMAFLELIEMTPEEYAMNMKDGIQKSEAANKQVDKDCIKILTDLGLFVQDKLKKYNVIFNTKDFENENYYSKNSISLKDKDKNSVSISYSNGGYFTIDFNWSGYSVYNKSDAEKKFKFQITNGLIAAELTKEKIKKEIITQFKKIEELQSTKTNISELKGKIQEFKKEQLKIQIQNKLAESTIIQFNGEVRLADHFRDARWGSRATQVRFERNKMMAVNKLVFEWPSVYKQGEFDRFIAKSVKPEKIIDILSSVELL
jgi:DNA repair protein RadD